MPLFGNAFSPKKTPPRRSASLSSLHTLERSVRESELGLEYGSPSMKIGDQILKFEDGQWVAETDEGIIHKDAQRLKKRNRQLEEENNLLKLKIDILLDMLSQTTVELQLANSGFPETRSYSPRRK
ncbi:protein chibby homolog 1-like [Erpetoichthys calabaricus]|uniref:Chibby 1, beta catenin antagonist n=1 Tax=Erpetoichthys calabaricus TaxID=27687 RepID=A0A8C4SA74_ERPCA|nr:protein chibby homolog 1-like [Erpetoichthys calabaricus]